MSSVTRPRGRLPKRVYWFRRLLVLAVAAALVFGIGKALGAGGDGSEETPQARVVAAPPSTSSTPRATPTVTRTPKKKPKKPELAQPTGPCTESDVVVTPSTNAARAGGDIPITLLVTTKVSEACTFVVSSETVVLKLTSGDDRIWSSQQCPKAIPTTTVVARKTVPGQAVATWHGHRSNDECSLTAPWALPGYYHAQAAALGSDATDVQFQLYAPERATITPKPKVKKPKSNG
jgi:hypothetical protein